MKPKTALVIFLLSFFLAGCYRDNVLVEEKKDAIVQVDIERSGTQLGEKLSEEEIKEKLEVAKVKADFNKWKSLAEQGNSEAQYNIGRMYYKGDGVPKDYKEAVKWYRKAAEQGSVDAQYMMGRMYYKGDGVPKDYKEAVKWYRNPAEQGSAGAQLDLGSIYKNKLKNLCEARYWYTERLTNKSNTWANWESRNKKWLSDLNIFCEEANEGLKFEAKRKAKIAQNLLKIKALNSCVDCNLSGVSLVEENLESAKLSGAGLIEANLSGANLSYANFSNALVRTRGSDSGRISGYLSGTYRANLTGANLTGANLKYASLVGAELLRANFTNADLTNADLRKANLTDANLTGATIKDARTEGAIFCNTKTPWGLDNSGCKK